MKIEGGDTIFAEVFLFFFAPNLLRFSPILLQFCSDFAPISLKIEVIETT